MKCIGLVKGNVFCVIQKLADDVWESTYRRGVRQEFRSLHLAKLIMENSTEDGDIKWIEEKDAEADING
jgi:hypothetical protein